MVVFHEGKFHVECAPHVMMIAKRVFPGVSAYARRTFHVKATPRTARDLEWFLSRFPLPMTRAASAVMKDLAARQRDTETSIKSVYHGRLDLQGAELATPAREYQKIAAALAVKTGRLIVADDVGLGKTCTAIAAIVSARAFPALVVTLTHLPPQWVEQFQMFAPFVDVMAVKSTKIPSRFRQPDVMVMNYHKLDAWSGALAGRLKAVVFDEVQELRRPDSNKHDAARKVAEGCDLRIGLSATPSYNYGSEYHAILSVLAPDEVGTKFEFSTEWVRGNWDKGVIEDPKAFGSYLRDQGLLIRRTRSEVGRELPPLSIIPHTVDADTKVLEDATDRASELARIILAQTGVTNREKMEAAGEMDWRLRQATGIAKAPYVAAFVEMLLKNSHKVVLYGWHREVYSIWQSRLAGYGPVMFTGSESPAQKDAAKRRFLEDPNCRVLVISLRAGAGLDGLQHVTDTVVFGELDWSPGVHEQCVGRVFRDGQKNSVSAFYLVADHGSDPVVVDVLGLKKQQIENIRDPEADLIEASQVDPNRMKRLAESVLKRGQA